MLSLEAEMAMPLESLYKNQRKEQTTRTRTTQNPSQPAITYIVYLNTVLLEM